ncbi:MAG: hypothetical protein ACTS73_02775 [Arsenophonus sp. NEOnobi-MAG3]
MLERRLLNSRHAIVRNSYLLQRTIQTSIGDLEIKVHKVKEITAATEYASIAQLMATAYLKCAKNSE